MERKESIGNDATNKQTVEDLEENEVSTDETEDDTSLPNPDGAFDQADELKKADPI